MLVICDLVQVFHKINNTDNENHDVLMTLGMVCLMPYKYNGILIINLNLNVPLKLF